MYFTHDIYSMWPKLMKMQISLVKNTLAYLGSKTYTTSDQFT